VPHTFSADGKLNHGDHILLANKQTNGFLVFDLDDRVNSLEEAYICTTTVRDIGPCGRSVLILQKAEEIGDGVVRYGDKVRFVTNSQIFHKPLHLHST